MSDYCWSYDAWGNRTQQLGATTAFPSTASGPSICNASQPQFVYNAQNRMTNSPTGAPVYDASGDITTGTAGNVYLYDAEGRICAVATAGMDGMGPSMTGYVYDAAGNRVAKGPITKWSCDPTQNGFEASGEESDYIHNQQGRPVTKLTMDEGVMTWNYTNVYADGQLFATYDAQGLHFDLNDWLGTRRVTTDYAGVVEQTCASLPYGDQLNCTGSQDAPNEQHFTGKTHDTESGLDYFGARYYNENDARWMSPDWSAKVEPVPYAKLNNPQSLNLYSYVLNNPLTLTDADGHTCADPKKGCTITVQFRAFIPQKSMDFFRGDNRTFSNAPNASSRVETTATINTDPTTNGGHPLMSSSSHTQPTTFLPTGTTRISNGPHLPHITATQAKNGSVTLHLTENMRNPFQPVGQGIVANVNISIPESGNSATVSGTLSGSPSFELNVSSQTGPTANIPIAGSSSDGVKFVWHLEQSRTVDVSGAVQ